MGKQSELIEASKKHLMNNYGPPIRAMVRGELARIWDADGKEYIDFFAGFGGGGITGHCHPRVTAALQKQAALLLSHGNFFTNPNQIELAQRVTSHAFGGKVFYCHSGAEANEAALKLTRLYAGEGRYKILSFHNCFHGRTMGGLSLTPENKQKGFEPMLPGNVKVPYGDLNAVRSAIDSETAGIFVEPIQGEGGVNIPTPEFMQGLRAICDEHDLVLTCDEVWTGPGRTGRWFGYQHFGMTPDVLTLAKAVGGGAPVAMCIGGPRVQDTLGPGTHGCTMGGNPLCTAAALEAIKIMEEDHLVERTAAKGEQLMNALRTANVPAIQAVRGKGFMIGIEIDRPAKDVMNAAMEAGLLICLAGTNIIRLAPPLVTPDADLDKGLEILLNVLRA